MAISLELTARNRLQLSTRVSLRWLMPVLLVLPACSASAHDEIPREAFYRNLLAVCGATFELQSALDLTQTDEHQTERTLLEFDGCDGVRIQLSVIVGTERLQSWVLLRTAEALELLHAHKASAATTAEFTDYYRGTTRAEGSARAQIFHADAATAERAPETSEDVWTVTLSNDSAQLRFQRTREGKTNYRANFGRLIEPMSKRRAN